MADRRYQPTVLYGYQKDLPWQNDQFVTRLLVDLAESQIYSSKYRRPKVR